MSFSLWLALQHLARARRSGFLGRVSILAACGVAVGVATLLTVFAFVQGFQTEVLALLTDMNPGVFVTATERGALDLESGGLDWIAAAPGVAGASPFIQQKGVLTSGEGSALRLRGIILRGVDPVREPAVTRVLAACDPPFAGFAGPEGPGVLLGAALAEELGVLPGETVTFTTLLEAKGTERRASHSRFFVLGTVRTGLYEFDRRFAYIELGAARRAFRAGQGGDGLGLRLASVEAAPAVVALLRGRLSPTAWQVASWQDLNGEIFRWIRTMRSVLFLALSLIILVAGFNIAGSMTIIVTERSREIGLLLALGASRATVLAVYLLEGWLLGLVGVLAGGLLGAGLIAWFSAHPLPLPGEVYFIDHLPARLTPALVLSIAGAAVLVAFFALVLPGLEALRRRPLDSLQGEGGIRA
ncbi:ABC transporter permease [bacterium]|nr:ABC transporter permease [bacterium]